VASAMRNFRLTYAGVTENIITWDYAHDLNSKQDKKTVKPHIL